MTSNEKWAIFGRCVSLLVVLPLLMAAVVLSSAVATFFSYLTAVFDFLEKGCDPLKAFLDAMAEMHGAPPKPRKP